MFRVCAILSMLLCAWSGCGDDGKIPADSGEGVEFADANLEAAIREGLEKPAGALSREELLAATRLFFLSNRDGNADIWRM